MTMMIMRLRTLPVAAALVTMLTLPAVAADAEHGKALFAPCAACHTDRADALSRAAGLGAVASR